MHLNEFIANVVQLPHTNMQGDISVISNYYFKVQVIWCFKIYLIT